MKFVNTTDKTLVIRFYYDNPPHFDTELNIPPGSWFDLFTPPAYESINISFEDEES